jgi:hypothetical protein
MGEAEFQYLLEFDDRKALAFSLIQEARCIPLMEKARDKKISCHWLFKINSRGKST